MPTNDEAASTDGPITSILKRYFFVWITAILVVLAALAVTFPTLLLMLRLHFAQGEWRGVVYDAGHSPIGEGYLDIRLLEWRPQFRWDFPAISIYPKFKSPLGWIRLNPKGVEIFQSHGDAFFHHVYELLPRETLRKGITAEFSGLGADGIVAVIEFSTKSGSADLIYYYHEKLGVIPVKIEFGRP